MQGGWLGGWENENNSRSHTLSYFLRMISFERASFFRQPLQTDPWAGHISKLAAPPGNALSRSSPVWCPPEDAPPSAATKRPDIKENYFIFASGVFWLLFTKKREKFSGWIHVFFVMYKLPWQNDKTPEHNLRKIIIWFYRSPSLPLKFPLNALGTFLHGISTCDIGTSFSGVFDIMTKNDDFSMVSMRDAKFLEISDSLLGHAVNTRCDPERKCWQSNWICNNI